MRETASASFENHIACTSFQEAFNIVQYASSHHAGLAAAFGRSLSSFCKDACSTQPIVSYMPNMILPNRSTEKSTLLSGLVISRTTSSSRHSVFRYSLMPPLPLAHLLPVHDEVELGHFPTLRRQAISAVRSPCNKKTSQPRSCRGLEASPEVCKGGFLQHKHHLKFCHSRRYVCPLEGLPSHQIVP